MAYREDLESGHRTYCSSKGYLEIAVGQIWVGTSSGGGGYGDPKDRPDALVKADVANGYVSPEAAKEIYGVAINEREG